VLKRDVKLQLGPNCHVLFVLSVCNVGVLWPNCWTAQDKTWNAGRPRRWPQCVRWGPSSPSPKGHSPQFSAHICCDQMAEWIKMPLAREVGYGPSDIVLDGIQLPLPKKGQSPQIFGPCLLWPNGWMDQDGTWHGGGPPSGHSALVGTQLPYPKKWNTAPNFRYISIAAKRLDRSRWHLTWR